MKPKKVLHFKLQSRLSELERKLAQKVGDPLINAAIAEGDKCEKTGKWVGGARIHKKVQDDLKQWDKYDPRKNPESHSAYKLNSATILNAENPKIKAGEDPANVFVLDSITGRYVEK
jgi:hypothetical protein